MEILAYIAALLIGVSLGLIGGGGSILTIPVLVYLFGVSPLLSTSYSLFIVGTTSFVGAVNSFRKGLVNIRTVLLFGLTSITTVFITRRFILPVIPDLFTIGSFVASRDKLTMLLFALLMFAAAVAMIRNESKSLGIKTNHNAFYFPKLMMAGLAIGLATGLLGAGGGFLLIPALVLLVGLPMKEAVGTSLLIIALNSLIGFTGDLGHIRIDWKFLLTITALAICGIIIGGTVNKWLNGLRLKKAFGWFVLLMAAYILVKEFIFT